MTKVEHIENQIQNLSAEELREFRQWFSSYDSALWDQEIERDASNGKFDTLRQEALAEHRAKRTTSL